MRKLRGYDLDPARREAPGPWRIGGRDDAGIHVLDANGKRVATIWKTPSRSVAALERDDRAAASEHVPAAEVTERGVMRETGNWIAHATRP
ncbi:MAG: hypothetical protein OXI73_12000 [Rhodospirillales bacterium]|nr:hypothetical protein [Rhodospirillales bacterium]